MFKHDKCIIIYNSQSGTHNQDLPQSCKRMEVKWNSSLTKEKGQQLQYITSMMYWVLATPENYLDQQESFEGISRPIRTSNILWNKLLQNQVFRACYSNLALQICQLIYINYERPKNEKRK